MTFMDFVVVGLQTVVATAGITAIYLSDRAVRHRWRPRAPKRAVPVEHVTMDSDTVGLV